MSVIQKDSLQRVETTCGSLLYELQTIWDEVGESNSDRDKMLLEVEQECLQVYKRKVEQANRSRAQLRQAIFESEKELTDICLVLGERTGKEQPDQKVGGLKEELKAIIPLLEEMRKRKCERRNQFVEVVDEIQKLSEEIYIVAECNSFQVTIDEDDLSLTKLEELNRRLQVLHKEKSDRLNQVLVHLNTLNLLCSVLGMDFDQIIREVHPSLGEPEGAINLTDDTIECLSIAIERYREIKRQRMQRLQDLATTMLELWNLMDTPIEEQQMFQNVTCNIAASEHEITEANTLTVDFIDYVEAEVSRLEALKASKMKELVLKKRSELEEICRRTHMIVEEDTAIEYAIEAIESGAADPSYILGQIELQISKVKEEAFSRKDILERVEKWLSARDEESWLEEYNRDDNRYNAGKGAHLTLKRAEKARIAVSKLPALVDALALKTRAWENDRGVEFTYDGARLLSMLEDDSILREEKEQERRRQRDQKKLQGQLIAEQEALFGSKPSPSKPQSTKKPLSRPSTGGATSSNRRLSLGGAMLQTPKPDRFNSMKPTPRTVKKGERALPQDDSFASLSAGRRGLDIAGLPVKKHTFNAAREFESPLTRKPFSPVSSVVSSKANNAANLFEDPNSKLLSHQHSQNNTQVYDTPLPSRSNSIASSYLEEENWTPRVITTTTPSTASVPMQTAATPAVPSSACALQFGAVESATTDEIEYSFEERRAQFILQV